MRIVADSHAIVWFLHGASNLSREAERILRAAEGDGDLVVSIVTFIDLWYVTQTTQAITPDQLALVETQLASSEGVVIEPVTLPIVRVSLGIPRSQLPDPWDRLIVGTSLALGAPLVTRDAAIRATGLVETVW